MTSALILNELDFDLSSTGLLVLWLVVIVIIVAATLDRVVVSNEGVVSASHGCVVALLSVGVEGVDALSLIGEGRGGWIGHCDARKGRQD